MDPIQIANAPSPYSNVTLPPISSFGTYAPEPTPSLSASNDVTSPSSTSSDTKRPRSTVSPVDVDEPLTKKGRPRKSSTSNPPPQPPTPSASTSTAAPTPAQSENQKRKEQNRAAQRAFRERKEKHVKELETKNASLSATVAGMSTECETLRELLARVQRENIQLKRTALTCSCSSSNASPLTPNTTPTIISTTRPSDFHKIGCADGFLA